MKTDFHCRLRRALNYSKSKGLIRLRTMRHEKCGPKAKSDELLTRRPRAVIQDELPIQEFKIDSEFKMAFLNIDAPGNRHNRRAVAAIQRQHGADDRKAKAQARREARAFKRRAIHFYPWPAGGVGARVQDGAYAQGPMVNGKYQIVVAGEPKGPEDDYAAALSAWLKITLRVESSRPLPIPSGIDRQFLSIVLFDPSSAEKT
jgi:hypothetical protein